jgi:tripartite-type tricarboxylate transporter receptor subunit TctC
MLRDATSQSGYPERSIKLTIPFSAGGVTDRTGRLWADRMKPLLGPVVVENQGGAGGLAGSATVARAQPDGYNLLLASVESQVAIPATLGPASYEPTKALEPISILVVTALCVVVHPGVPAANLTELVAHAKANPGKLSYGSAGAGTMPHLAGELFKSQTGTAIVHVPYKGGGQAIGDLINGHIPMMMTSITAQLLALHQAGKIRIVAVMAPARTKLAPEIPTAAEAGYPGMIAQNSFGLFAPAGTPKDIVAQIVQATHTAMADDDFRNRLIATGLEPYVDSSPEAAQGFVNEEIRRWAPVIKAIGLKVE